MGDWGQGRSGVPGVIEIFDNLLKSALWVKWFSVGIATGDVVRVFSTNW